MSNNTTSLEIKVEDFGLLPNVTEGPFKPTWESLQQYECPDWFRDAKLGIWAHWGPQAVGEAGDWYAKFLYCPTDD